MTKTDSMFITPGKGLRLSVGQTHKRERKGCERAMHQQLKQEKPNICPLISGVNKLFLPVVTDS